MQPSYTIHAFWDEEASVWVAESDDVPGLATYGDSMDHLIEKLNVMIPELLEANGVVLPQAHAVPYRLLSELVAAKGC